MSENGNYHDGESISRENFEDNFSQIYSEDLEQFESSAFYAAIYQEKIIGSVKVSLWDGFTTLPIQKLFGINCSSFQTLDGTLAVWHVGRLAISKDNPMGISLLKQLLTLAIYSICKYPTKGIMVAECDKKLLRILNLLGIKTKALAPGIEYLGSETIPIYSTTEWLSVFLKSEEQLQTIAAVPNLKVFEQSLMREEMVI